MGCIPDLTITTEETLNRTLTTIGLALLLANAATAADYQSCTTIKPAKDRLACFDKVSADQKPKGTDSKSSKDIARKEVERFKQALTSRFKDPSSAQFKNVAAYGEQDPISVTFLCGYVNAKNSYGAYVGFKKFVMTGTDTVQYDDPDNPFAIEEKWKAACTGTELYQQE